MSSGKGKYGDLIRKARQPESQVTSKPEKNAQDQVVAQSGEEPVNQIDGKPDNQMAKNPESQVSNSLESKITGLPDNQITGEPGNQATIKPEEKMVNLCVKVPESKRRYWAAQAKLQGITMTEVMVSALEIKFGNPAEP